MGVYINTKAGRTYNQVAADAGASAYLDAGVIHFDSDAMVDSQRSLGLKSHGLTYCVAPVLSKSRAAEHGDTVLPVEFWAVGPDCCSSRSNFECGNAGDVDAHGGLM